jgi:hypothetical protein
VNATLCVHISLIYPIAVSLAPTDMSAVVPVQYLADMVVLISDAATGNPVLAVIIEPQLRDSATKRYSWPVYLTTARRVRRPVPDGVRRQHGRHRHGL